MIAHPEGLACPVCTLLVRQNPVMSQPTKTEVVVDSIDLIAATASNNMQIFCTRAPIRDPRRTEQRVPEARVNAQRVAFGPSPAWRGAICQYEKAGRRRVKIS